MSIDRTSAEPRFGRSAYPFGRPLLAPRPPRRRPLRAARPALLLAAPELGSESFRLWSLWLGHRLADDGAAPIEGHLARFAATAIELGIETASARVLADRDRGDVERSRAFFKVAMALDDFEPIPPDDPLAA